MFCITSITTTVLPLYHYQTYALGPSVPETTPQKTLTPPLKEASKSDPKVLEKLDEQAKAQKQLAGNLDGEKM